MPSRFSRSPLSAASQTATSGRFAGGVVLRRSVEAVLARPAHGSMVAFGVQPEFTCKLTVAGEEHCTDDADDVAGVRFVGVLNFGSDGCIESLFVHGATWGRVFSLLLTEGGCSEGLFTSVTTIGASPPIHFFLS